MALPTTLKRRLLENLWRISTKATATITSSDDPLFSVADGRIILYAIIGEVTTSISATANLSLIKVNPTTGDDYDLCTTSNLTGRAAGVMLSITGDTGDGLQLGFAGEMMATAGIVCPIGDIELECSASPAAGSIKWDCLWIPFDTGASVSAA